MTEPLKQALVIRALKAGRGGLINGAALAALRADVRASPHHDVATRDAEAERARLMAVDLQAMPPDSDDVGLLLETLSQRLGGHGYASAWRAIGINPHRGRDLLTRRARAVDWPIWKTLRDAALGGEKTSLP